MIFLRVYHHSANSMNCTRTQTAKIQADGHWTNKPNRHCLAAIPSNFSTSSKFKFNLPTRKKVCFKTLPSLFIGLLHSFAQPMHIRRKIKPKGDSRRASKLRLRTILLGYTTNCPNPAVWRIVCPVTVATTRLSFRPAVHSFFLLLLTRWVHSDVYLTLAVTNVNFVTEKRFGHIMKISS